MIKLMIVGRRAPGRSRRAAQAHLRDVHAPMVVRAPPDAGPLPSDYVQNHVIDGVYPAGSARHAIERDLVTELWFENADQMRASVATPYYLANLRPDEPRFVDDATVERLLMAETIVREGARGDHKLFVFTGPDDSDADLLAANGLTALTANIAQPSPFGPPLAERVLEAWFDSEDTAAAALDALGGQVLAVAARQYDSAALRARSPA